MKNLLRLLWVGGWLAGTLWVPASLYAQAAPPNDSCKNATQIPVLPNKVYQQYSFNYGHFEADTPHRAPCIPAYQNQNDVWYKVVNTSFGLIFHLSISNLGTSLPYFEFYHGSCGNLVYDTCGFFYFGDTAQTYLLPQPPGTTTYIRFVGAGRRQVPNPIRLAAQEWHVPRRVISKRVTGQWLNPSSWVGNVAPSYFDTVVIDDGAVISVQPLQMLKPAKIVVGQADTLLPARLISNSDGKPFTLSDSLLVHTRDTLELVWVASECTLRLKKNLHLDGVLKLTDHGMLQLIDPGNQVLEGKGQLLGPWGLQLNKPDTVFQSLPLQLRQEGFFTAGVIMSRAPITWHSPFPPGLFNPEPYITVANGVVVNPHFACNSDYTLQFGSHSPTGSNGGQDSVIHVNQYFWPGVAVTLNDNRNSRDTCYISGNKTIHYCGYGTDASRFNGILKAGTGDTVFIGQGNSHQELRYAHTPAGIIAAAVVFNPALVPSVNDTTFLPLFKNGNARLISFSSSPLIKAAGQTLTVNVVPQAPDGLARPPISGLLGNFVFKITSNRDTLPAACKMRMYFETHDSLGGNRLHYMVAQSDSPYGPWTGISPLVGASNGTSVTSNTGIDFRKGNYFCLATTEKGYDVAFDWAQTSAPALIGAGMPPHTLNFSVNNQGASLAFSAKVSWKIDTPVPITGTDSIAFVNPLNPGKSVALTLNPSALINVPYTGRFLYTLVLDSTAYNQFIGPGDTIRFYMDNRPKTIPYLQTYDTIAMDCLPAQYRSQPVNPRQIIRGFNAFAYPYVYGGLLTAYSQRTGSIVRIFTEPVLLQPGKTYFKATLAAYYENNNPSRPAGDTMAVAYTIDSGHSYIPIHRFSNAEILDDANPNSRVKMPYTDSISVAQPTMSHLRFSLYSGQNSSFYRLDTDSLQFALTPFHIVGLLPAYTSRGLSLYPNPTASSFRIAGLTGPQPVVIYNLSGQKVAETTAEPYSPVDVQNLPPGLYQVRAGNTWLRLAIGE